MKEFFRPGGLPKRRTALIAALIAALCLSCPGISAIGALPGRLSLTAGSRAALDFALPGSAELKPSGTGASLSSEHGTLEIDAGTRAGSASLIFRLLGIIPVKTVAVEVAEPRTLIPGGRSIGIALETDGLIVVGMSDLPDGSNPARSAGLMAGDVIRSVNGQRVRSAEALASALRPGEAAQLTLVRDEREITVEILPGTDTRDGAARIGAWVRSSTAGVGTLTFVDPESGRFGALGHAVSDVDTGITLPVQTGGVYESRVAQINRGEAGLPGEIVGDFLADKLEIGTVTGNTDYGVFGENYSGGAPALYPEGLPVAARSEVHTGAATLITTLDDTPREYSCEITQIDSAGERVLRALTLKITDPELLERTGGIVQGMSGSPILQDGHLVGAVTHVFVNDPSMGYGTFLQSMLETQAELTAVGEAA